ncbi:MAG: methylated-DNA--[protein]-cysteine S-methyltransferase [Candidatus Peribacteraceae bacterium]|nr:methylated-DNA--[protein]-cysteine S-methyltransferase [Candidatus Peribacteraceae bacterium]
MTASKTAKKANRLEANSKQHEKLVATACKLIETDTDRSDLTTLAKTIGMSPSHFQRVFTAIMGISPKAYALALRAKRLQTDLPKSKNVTEAIYKTGFSSSGRFYENAPQLLGMTPTAFKAGGKGMTIRFAIGECSLGSILVAATAIGICMISMGDDPDFLLKDLQNRFPKAQLIGTDRDFEKLIAMVIGYIERPVSNPNLPLDIQGTAFQQRVWQALQKIPLGKTATYAEIAQAIGRPKAVRAVALACGANKIAVLIPCHRVIRTDGSLSGYYWGVERKVKLLEREQQKQERERRAIEGGCRGGTSPNLIATMPLQT